jgi:acyl-CoA dehydrogenase
MDFNLPDELQMLKDTVRKFVDKELIPIEMHTIENMELKPDIRAKLEKKNQRDGTVDVRCAGRIRRRRIGQPGPGAGMGRAFAHGGITLAGPGNLRAGGPADSLRPQSRAEKTLHGSGSGREKKLCFMQTEPDAGSDPASMKTRAVRQGDYYIINGTKRFITGAGDADLGN